MQKVIDRAIQPAIEIDIRILRQLSFSMTTTDTKTTTDARIIGIHVAIYVPLDAIYTHAVSDISYHIFVY